MGIDWDTVEESRNYQEGTLFPPEEQFKNVYPTEEEQIENADDLLIAKTDLGYRTIPYVKKGSIVYHGGNPLNQEKGRVFFVSFNQGDAVNYGPITTYRVTQTLPVISILWDQLAANYGFDVDLEGYDSWEDFDDDFDLGKFGEAQKEAEMKAHQILAKAYSDRPLVIGSWQDNELGFFPSAHFALEQIQ